MLFIAICKDKPDSVELRMRTRPAHLDWLKSLGARVKIGGAMLTPDQKTPTASVLIFEGDDEDEIRTLAANDPYAEAGLFESVTIAPWRQAVGFPLS